MRRWRRLPVPGPLLAAVLSGAFFIWIFSARVLAPTEYEWVFKLDWRVHFLGWHMFRQEPWHVPPGRIDGYGSPIGTTIGLTDSIPLVALALKPFASALPMPFQYLGAWLFVCYVLQAFFGALLARLWTTSALVQALSGCCFIVVPTLLRREMHPALCAHWLLLWALWLYFRADRDRHISIAQIGALALIAGLVHPYLAVMVAALIGAIAARTIAERGVVERPRRISRAVAVLVVTATSVLAGWWASGFFTVPLSNLTVEGFGIGAMNLLGPIIPSGWSSLLPDWWRPTHEGWYEGFQYLGVGLLTLIASASGLRLVIAKPRIAHVSWPVLAVCAALTLYAVSPRVVIGDYVITHIDWPAVLSTFRVNGRFFWPAACLLITLALATLITRTRTQTTVLVLVGVLGLQMIDVRAELATRHDTWRDPTFYRWSPPLTSPLWSVALPHYDHIVVYQPPQCGPSPTMFEDVVYLAGLHGLTVNGVLTARADDEAWRATCAELDRSLLAGEVDPHTVYLLPPIYLSVLQARAREPMTCGIVDNVGVCVTLESHQPWRDAAPLR